MEGVNGNSTYEAIEQALARLDESEKYQAKFKKWNLITTIAIVVVFVFYIILFYQMFTKNLSQENFAAEVQPAVEQVAPQITEASLEVFTDVTPIYLEEGRKKAEAIMPELISILEKQSDIFITNLSSLAEKELEASLTRIVEAAASEFRAQHPDLTDQQLLEFVDKTEESLKTLFIELAEDIIEQTLPEISVMKATAEEIAAGAPPLDTLELSRLLIHKLLLLLDQEIMEGGIYDDIK